MKPAEIARKLGKDKAWVSRTIARLETEQATDYRSPKEAELVGENLRQLESLLASALAAAQREKDGKTHLAALRTAADLLRQKTEYEITVGHIQRREKREDVEKSEVATEFYEGIQEDLPESAVMAILERLVESRRLRASREAQQSLPN
jgi:hypothetical protein